MFCKECGNQLQEGAKFCNKCGTDSGVTLQKNDSNQMNYTVNQNQTQMTKAPTNMLCTLGIIFSGVSVLINIFSLISLAGLILSIIGLVQVNAKGENGKGLAITGIILGAFCTIYFYYNLYSVLSYY